MIFKPIMVEAISAGQKTMTRRLVKPGEKECRYKEGGLYSVQPGRGERSRFKVTVVKVRKEKLGAISQRDARREGFKTVSDFFAYWRELHGEPDRDADVWVILFAKGDFRDIDRYLAQAAPAQFCQATDRKTGKRCGRAFKDNQGRCKCGALRPEESMDDIGYTRDPHRGLAGEKAAIPRDLQERYSHESRNNEQLAKTREWGERRSRIVGEIESYRARGDLSRGEASKLHALLKLLETIDRRKSA